MCNLGGVICARRETCHAWCSHPAHYLKFKNAPNLKSGQDTVSNLTSLVRLDANTTVISYCIVVPVTTNTKYTNISNNKEYNKYN